MNETWLLTGGAGYIGSHVAQAMISAGYRLVVLDDLSSGRADRLDRDVALVVASISDPGAVQKAMADHGVQGVVHLAAKKSVEASVADPVHYYRQNVSGLLTLLEAMQALSVPRLVFSSSAAVYGTPITDLVSETSPTLPESPYGRTKLAGEWMVHDAAAAGALSAVSLRYFNVVGSSEPRLADTAGTNLFPQIIQRMRERRPAVVFGADYPTTDGTCVRDYIHVVDLARAHLAAVRLTAQQRCDEVINIGCGRGHSVLEVIREFAAQSGQDVDRVVAARRPGDPASVVADNSKALRMLDWHPAHGLPEMVGSAWSAAVAQGWDVASAGVGG